MIVIFLVCLLGGRKTAMSWTQLECAWSYKLAQKHKQVMEKSITFVLSLA